MDGIWGIKEFKQETAASRELLTLMRKRAKLQGRYQDSTFAMDSAGLGCWLAGADGFNPNLYPLHNENSTVYAVSSGTICNWEELRSDLERKGHKFYTTTDAEVIVHLYEEMGESFAAKLYGNFVIALWDKPKDLLILARDQLGAKPLYYTKLSDKLIFASDLKLISAHPDVQAGLDVFALAEYFTFEYVPGPKTIFTQINKLLPAQVLVCQAQNITLKKYWQASYQENKLSPNEICGQIITKLKESIKYNLAGDGPKGVFLSGGTDSSTIVGLMRELGCHDITTFSAVFKDEAFNESANSLLVSRHFNTKHHQIVVTPKEVSVLLEDIFGRLDEPLADASVLPTYLVAGLAQKEGMKVCLSGDGGDELFGGYDTYNAMRFVKYASRLPLWFNNVFSKIVDWLPARNYRGLNFKLKKFKAGIGLPPEVAYYIWWGAYTAKEEQNLFTKELNNILGPYDTLRVINQYLQECSRLELLNRVFYMDLKFNLPDGSLRKSERMAGLNFLEARSPFLYPPLVELATSIPYYLKVHGWATKCIFKKSIKPYLPAKIIKTPKKGFDIPLEDWIRKELKDFVFDSLSESIIKKQGFLNHSYIQKLLKEHCSGKANHRQKIWPVVVFTRWYASVFN